MNDPVHQRVHNYCNRIMGGLAVSLYMHGVSHVHNDNEAVSTVQHNIIYVMQTFS